MKKSLVSKAAALVGALAMTFGFAACGQTNTADSSNSNTSDLKKVTFMLSWAPDTNHIGVYVAKNKGYFKDAGLDVDIVAVAQAGAEQAVNNGVADFALSNLTNVGVYTLKGAHIKQVLQVQFMNPDNPAMSYRVDFCWKLADGRIIVAEYDGMAKYADISNKNRASLQAKMEYDRRRDRHLREQGVTEIVHVFYEDLLRPINLETKLLKAGVPKIR